MSKKYLFFIFLLVFSSVVFSDKIIDVQEGGTLTISYPPNQVFKQGVPFNYTFMVHNSTGHMVNDVNCTFFLINNAQELLISNATMGFDGGTNIYFIEINNSVVDNLGQYNYHLMCLDGEAGFLNSGFEITRTGFQENTDGSNYVAVILALGLFVIVMNLAAYNIKEKDLEDVKAVFFLFSVVFSFLVAMFSLIIIYNPSRIISSEPVMIGLFSSFGIIMIMFIWLYGKFLIFRMFNKYVKISEDLDGRDKKDRSF